MAKNPRSTLTLTHWCISTLGSVIGFPGWNWTAEEVEEINHGKLEVS